MRAFKTIATKTQQIELNIVAEDEDQALEIMEKLVEEYDMFDKKEEYEIIYDALRMGDIYDLEFDDECVSCEHFCPVCGECTIDE